MTNVLLIGGNYFPNKEASDKNYWVDFLNHTNKEYHILSFNTKGLNKLVKNRHTIIYKPYFRLSGKHMIYKNVGILYLENTLTLIKNLRFIREYTKAHNITIIHFMDNYGPINSIICKWFGVKTSLSAVSYLPRSLFYDFFLKLSMATDKIIAYSHHFRHRLFELHIPKCRLATIHWGVLKQKFKHTHKDYILWSGFLQQTTIDDFKYAIKVAQNVQKIYPRVVFIFAFKPEHYKSQYQQFERDNIKIITNCDFNKLAKEANLFLCPITRKNVIVAPPLTWIEMMSYGVPVITNDVSGASELIHENNGIICQDEDDFTSKIVNYIKNSKLRNNLRKNAINKVTQDFDLRTSVKQYEQTWEALASE